MLGKFFYVLLIHAIVDFALVKFVFGTGSIVPDKSANSRQLKSNNQRICYQLNINP